MKPQADKPRTRKYRKLKNVRQPVGKRVRREYGVPINSLNMQGTNGLFTGSGGDINKNPKSMCEENGFLKEKVAEQQKQIKSLEGQVKTLKELHLKHGNSNISTQESAQDKSSEAPATSSQAVTNSDKNFENGESSKHKTANCVALECPQQAMETTLVALKICSLQKTKSALSNSIRSGANQSLSLIITAEEPLGKAVENSIDNAASAISEFLKLHVTSILKLEFGTKNVNFTSYFQNDRHWHQTLITWLNLMPNLQEITIYSYNYGKSRCNDLASLANSQQFPYFSNLRCLTSSELPSSLLRKILVANSHIASIKCIRPSRRLDDIDAFENLLFPNLIEFTYLDIKSKTQNLDALDDLHAPLLNKLLLGNLENIPVCQNLFVIIPKFQTNLKILHLGVIRPAYAQMEFPNLPALQELKFELKYDIAIRNPKCFFELVRPLQSLERLQIRQPETPSIVKFDKSHRRNRLNGLFISSLWKLLHKLYTVKLCDILYRM